MFNDSKGAPYTAHLHTVGHKPGLNGFRWFVIALLYPETKSGHNNDTYLLGKPARRTVAGPFSTRDEAVAACPKPWKVGTGPLPVVERIRGRNEVGGVLDETNFFDK